MAEQKTQKQNVGNAGEYYIASRLSEKDFIVTITLGRAERYDIMAIGPRGRFITISVKTTQLERAKDFPLSVKDEKGQREDFYYAFIKLNKFKKEPDFWIIPSKIVCPIIQKAHKKWEEAPNKDGNRHGFSTIRILPIEMTEGQRQYYPLKWEEEVKKYYKNLEQLF